MPVEITPPMNRRTFLAGSSALLMARQAAPAATGPVARILPMNRNWLFGGKSVPGAAEPAFDDRHFERVTLPHTNKLLPWHSFDDKSYEYISIYRRHFKLPAGAQGHRVFVDFEGAMTASAVTLNGHKLGDHLGGYTPFSFELTPHLQWTGDNLLAVEVDSTERKDIPPFGNNIDYLTFGGIYREVNLRIVPRVFIENVFAKPVSVMDAAARKCVVRTYVTDATGPVDVAVELRDGNRVIQKAAQSFDAVKDGAVEVELSGLETIELWDLDRPKLYDVAVRMTPKGAPADEYTTRIGFREGRFTPAGFRLNGKPVKLRGLNRHQTFPYVGGAMPARVQKRDALVLRKDLHCNLVRTSHYPQSRHFLDGCDEAGLLVFEEIPGWQFIGDQAWQDVAVQNVGEMVRRDWNHPSIVLWGVRINESRDSHDFYTRTNALAHSLDDSRQTGGVRTFATSELLEDVFTRNDFGFPLVAPDHPLYLNTEFNGHMFSTKHVDNVEHVVEHVLRHARVHNQLAGDDRYAGGIAWCAFDYNTHANFGSGDRICYHGVSDIFRIPKKAAGFYKSQCNPAEEIVLEPAFNWASGDHPGAGGPGKVAFCSNCEHLKLYLGDRLFRELDPDRATYANLKYPPFVTQISTISLEAWRDLKIEGYIGGKLVITKTLSGAGLDADLKVEPDDTELEADGSDATRVVLRVTDQFGNVQQFASGAVSLSVAGPAEIVGENPFSIVGGVGAVWLKARETAGTVQLTAKHQYLGTKTVEVRVKAATAEGV
jgi:beta-galactosidase